MQSVLSGVETFLCHAQIGACDKHVFSTTGGNSIVVSGLGTDQSRGCIVIGLLSRIPQVLICTACAVQYILRHLKCCACIEQTFFGAEKIFAGCFFYNGC